MKKMYLVKENELLPWLDASSLSMGQEKLHSNHCITIHDKNRMDPWLH
jgi:tRNA pseudouridine-54 N-methylase